MKRLTLLLAGLIAVLVALPAQGDSGPVGTGKGVFQALCLYSHSLADDPIVSFASPGASHQHDFVGGENTNAFTTNTDSRADSTTCRRLNSPTDKLADRSSYWVPTLYVDDEPVRYSEVSAYYTAGVRDLDRIEPFPENLRMIAGDKNGVAAQENNGQRVYFWECNGGQVAPGTATTAPTCVSRLDLTVRFPDCWDGIHDDSLDHKSHMAYSSQAAPGNPRRVCDSAHPVLVPMLQLNIRYPTTAGPSTRLASGSIKTAHGDFMNGWDMSRLDQLVVDCLVADKYCGGSDAPVPGH